MKKLSDVSEISATSLHIRHPYDTSTAWEDKPIVLHIVDRTGKAWGKDSMWRDQLQTIEITRCNRVAESWDFGTSWSKVNAAIEGVNGYKFCSRCGTKEDFIRVMEEADKRNEEYAAQRKEEEKLQEAHFNNLNKRLSNAASLNKSYLTDCELNPVSDDDYTVSYTVEIDGKVYKYTVTVEEFKKEE